MLSRHFPIAELETPSNPFQVVEAVLTEASAPLSAFLSLVPPSLPSNLGVFSSWRKRHHETLERMVRDTGYEYVIVRAPFEVQTSRPGAVEPIVALSEADLRSIATSSRAGKSPPALSIGALDLAECVVQSLLLEEVSGVSFTVCAAPSQSIAAEDRRTGTGTVAQRAARGSYYSILALDDSVDPEQSSSVRGDTAQQAVVAFDEAKAAEVYSEMRSTYIIR